MALLTREYAAIEVVLVFRILFYILSPDEPFRDTCMNVVSELDDFMLYKSVLNNLTVTELSYC